MDPIARLDNLEAELDALIRKRHAQRVDEEGERASAEALWVASCRKYSEMQGEEQWWTRLHHARAMRRSHTKTFAELDQKWAAEEELCESMLGLTSTSKKAS